MQILLLSLIIGIFIHDAQAQLYGDELATPQGWLVAALLLPKLVVAGVFHLCCIVTRRRMTGATAHRQTLGDVIGVDKERHLRPRRLGADAA